MRRYLPLVLLLILTITSSLCAQPSFSEEEENVIDAQLSPEYLDWLEQRGSDDSRPRGVIPFPADLSHLADNPPDEALLYPGGRNRAGDSLPSTYDLRNVNGNNYVTSVKNQNPFGACWAFAALGAMESNYLMQTGETLDLSEYHIAYFSYYNSDKSKAFGNIGSKSVKDILDTGGNSFMPTALCSRLDGPTLESLMPYPTSNNPTRPTTSTPESYKRVLRLRDVYYLSFSDENANVNASSTQRDAVKRRIMATGAVAATYFDSDDGYNHTNAYYADNYYYDFKSSNHAVMIVGWDDNYSASKFKTNPGIDGAWLIKNSWGTSFSNNGYIWMSYAQYLREGAAFTVEEVNSDMKAYYYDPLGWTGASNKYTTSQVYMANSFKATRDDEKLIEVGFYTTDNNQTCKISVYTNQGTSMPSSPASGTLAVNEQTYTHPYAGYHTVNLNTSVALTKGQYFSVIVKYEGTGSIPLSSKVTGVSDNYKFQEGSFFSPNGSSWIRGYDWTANAPLKAFTITAASDEKPSITTKSISDAAKDYAYSFTLSAKGAAPITWSLASGSLPDGLSLDKDGTISGTATTLGTSTFTVKASNVNGETSRSFTLTVTNLPTITTTSLTGYLGYSMNEQLKLSANTTASWAIDSDTLPKELKKITINQSTGVITGKPSKAGTYEVTVSATTSAGTSTSKITFNINAKPVKATIKTSKLTAVKAGESVKQTLETKGTTPITFELISGLPSGLGFDSSTGTFSGAPTVCGTYTIQVAASNIYNIVASKDPAVKKIKITITGVAPVISTNALSYGIKDEEYSSTTVRLSAGTLPITWKASGLPKGLTIDEDGVISGTPLKAGTFNVKITAKNNGGSYKTDKIPMTVYDVPLIKTKKLKNATAGKAYSLKLSIKNNPATVAVYGLPNGLSTQTDSKGNTLITGTPSTAGSYSVTISADNPAGSASTTLSLTVKGTNKSSVTSSMPSTTTSRSYVQTEPPAYEQTDETRTPVMPRVESELTTESRAVLDDGYTVIAVLPEMSADKSGMYDLNVELDESAETGSEMFYLAFPKNADESEDDEIAEFYDEDGREISCVPESHVVNVSVWLNEGVIYEPVIAVKR